MNYDQQAPTAVTSPVLLSVSDTAAELNSRLILVRRLIARRRLDATRMLAGDGSEGEWKVRREALSQYVSQGAPDLDAPKIDGAWFTQDLQQAARPFPQALTAAAADGSQRLTDAQVLSASKDTNTVYATLKVTDRMRGVINGPVPRSTIPSARPLHGQFSTFGELWLAATLQDFAAAAVDQVLGPHGIKQRLSGSPGVGGGPRIFSSGQGAPRIEMLYGSPDDYEAVLSTTIVNTLARKAVAFSEERVVAGSYAGDPRNKVTVTYVLPISSFATKAQLDRLAATSAF
jgi:hypothetical protein